MAVPNRYRFLFISIISYFLILPSVWAQRTSQYDLYPQIKSYLQMPVLETGAEIGEEVSIPKITEEEMGEKKPAEELPEEKTLEIPEYPAIILDKKIDPARYIVGPGDLIKVYLWGELDVEYRSRVTPEGYIIIPTVGAIKVSDQTLAEVDTIVKSAINKKYKNIDVTVYLDDPRRFRVNVSGLITKPGWQVANGLMRVSDLMKTVEPIEVVNKKGSSQRSVVIHRDGKELYADLLKFNKMGNIDDNPYIQPEDKIYVSPYIGDIQIMGEVNNQGLYEFHSGDRIYDLVMFGGGLTAVSDTSQATLVRFGPDGKKIHQISINLYDALYNNPDSQEYLLQESDRLFIYRKYDYKEPSNVRIDGQVKFPGIYAIIPRETKLTEIIRMAGGFSDNANLEEAKMTRPTTSALRDLEFDRLRKMSVAEMTTDEYEYFKHRLRTFEGLIAVDFVKLFRDNDITLDVELQDGDVIFIPLKREMVNVLGAVRSPGYVKLEKGMDINHYIQKAGGYNWDAHVGGVRIVKAKTGQRFKPGKNITIEGGDIVHVPEKKPVSYWGVFKDTAQIFANVATIVIVAKNVVK
jgi:protein involved in polysaccharide export with SLBB domain